jgi:hypothetical protein
MKSSSTIPALLAAAGLAMGGFAWAQTGSNTGSTAGGASTNPGAGVVTSGTAAPQAQTPSAPDTTLGKNSGGTGAGMGTATAGKSDADPKKASAKASKKSRKDAHAKSKKKAAPKSA